MWISPITHLTLVPGGDPRLVDEIEKDALKACLQLPRALVLLTLYLPCPYSWADPGPDEPPNCMILNDKMWQILCCYKQTLEYLDLYDQDAGNNGFELSRIRPHLGALNDFKCLHTLRIQPEMLLGGTKRIIEAPFRLHNAIPESLRALTMYNSQNGTPGLEKQLREVVEDPLFSHLEFLTVNRNFHHGHSRLAFGNDVQYKDTPLYRLCKDHGVLFKLASRKHFPLGGVNLKCRAEAYDTEKWLREAVDDETNSAREGSSDRLSDTESASSDAEIGSKVW